jgi:dTDP-4-amino-4,6-dideoxygalactose transaminase
VHLYGQVCDMDAVRALADRRGLAVIEDAAQAHGARSRGARAGSFGTAAAFSFYPSKNLGALGDGGAICTNDDEIAIRARALRNLGQRRKGEHEMAGFNERLDGIQAAMLRAKLPHLDEWNDGRRRAAARYRELLPDAARLLGEREDSPCIYHLFPVRVDDRDGLAEHLGAEQIQTGVHYSPAVPAQPPFAAAAKGSFPVADAWARDELSLPMYETLTVESVERVAEACAAGLGQAA